jgi:hypothetical protein
VFRKRQLATLDRSRNGTATIEGSFHCIQTIDAFISHVATDGAPEIKRCRRQGVTASDRHHGDSGKHYCKRELGAKLGFGYTPS